ncbi:hypothetical protein DL95DRAFT_417531 [Leptodontidium sp. 2 PMI_412]|nr:hypothetical protein DL95DRAFT_417531 [Leptodontidium sp. 2 PMI_412]
MFDLPTVYFTRAWSRCQISDTEAFLYRFNNQNLWDGPWKGRATHAQDVAFLFQNYRDVLSAGQLVEQHGHPMSMILSRGLWFITQVRRKIFLSTSRIKDLNGQVEGIIILQKVVGEELLDKLVIVWQKFIN